MLAAIVDAVEPVSGREAAAPGDNESRDFINEQVAAAGGAEREDVVTWFDYIDLDDHVTFGGKA